MASAKELKLLDLQEIVAPEEALEAAQADPGQVEEVVKRQTQRDPGRPDTITVSPVQRKDEQPPEPPPPHWIGVGLKDPEGKPVPSEKFRVKMGDGSIVDGTLDEKGYRRVEGVEPGNAEVCFPDIDSNEWKKA